MTPPRWYCRLFHRGRYLRPSYQGRGSLRCSRCGAGFLGLGDAGQVRLDAGEDYVSARALARVLRRSSAEAAPLEAGMLRVVRGGRLTPDTSDLSGRRVEGGSTVRLIRPGRSS
jgi:hypothetical protein